MGMQELSFSDEVKLARLDGGGLVALESTLISHGLPYPDNVRVANAAEAAVRASGSIPATIAVVDGVTKIGLEAAEQPDFERRFGSTSFVKGDATSWSDVAAAKRRAQAFAGGASPPCKFY